MSQVIWEQAQKQKARKILDKMGLDASYLDSMQIIKARPNDVLFKPGDRSQAYLILLNGIIRVGLTTKTGRELVLYRVHEAETCLLTTTALLRDEIYYTHGIAESEIIALALPKQDFERALQTSHEFMRHVMADYAERVENLVELVDRLAERDISASLMACLREMADDFGIVNATQIELARNIGTAREVIARKLARLEAQGIISRKGRQILIK